MEGTERAIKAERSTIIEYTEVSGDIPVAFDPKNPPNPEVDDCWLVYRMDDGGGHVYDSEPVAREAMRRHRHDGRPAFLFRSVRPKEQ